MLSNTDMTQFFRLFAGAKDFYGVTVVGSIVDGKAQSTSTCYHSPITPSVIEKHLNGEISIGSAPLKADNTVDFGAIDIDSYEGDLQDIISCIYEYELPICPCYSKSKKLHLYFFFADSSQAEDAVEIMKWYARAFACSKKVEIFPKQLKRSEQNRAYSWINLPYYNASDMENHRKMVRADGSIAAIGEFLDRAARCQMSIEKHRYLISTLPYHDAPPCLLSSVWLNDVGSGGRNNFLFSVGVYWKLKEENEDEDIDLEYELMKVNDRLAEPLPERELQQTVIASLNRKSYFYMCSSMNHCDKSRCMKLELGVGSSKSTGLSYGDIKQYKTDPAYYTWEVNGQVLTFYSEQEVLGQHKFRELCMRELHVVPRKVDDNKWTAIVNKALQNVEVIVPDQKGGDFSKGSQFYELVCAYFLDKRKAANISQVRLGRVWTDEDSKCYVFSASAFLAFIRDAKSFKGLTDMEMKTRLQDLGAYSRVGLWYLPQEAIDVRDEDMKEPEIDFSTHEGESNDF